VIASGSSKKQLPSKKKQNKTKQKQKQKNPENIIQNKQKKV